MRHTYGKYRQSITSAFDIIIFRLTRDFRNILIGDSHSSFLIHNSLKSSSYNSNIWNYYLGPKTLFSIAHKGVSLSSENVRNLQVIRPHRAIFLFGEIDVRTRLAETPNHNLLREFSVKYIGSLMNFCDLHSISKRVILEAPPPTNSEIQNPDYPFSGTLEERVAVHNLFFSILDSECANKGISFVPFPQILKNKFYELDMKHSFDGCHLNESANTIWLKSILDTLP